MNGRAVVITGLPFPPKMDAKVRLKMNFLDESLQKAKSFSSKGLSGRQWYRQQASRAVNQAVGRVIRHKQDFGAILLCDVRFTYPDAVQQLPSWMKPYVKVYKDFGSVQRDLIHFFRTADKMVDKSSMKVKSFKNNSSRAENPSAKTISGENLSHMSIEETELQKNKRKETGNEVKTQAAREAPVSSLRLKYVYKSSGVKDMANTAKPASLIESLTNSEAASNTELPKESQEQKERSLSEAIMKRKESNRRTQPRKVLKVVKVKEEEKPRSSADQQKLLPNKAQKLTEAKMYIREVKQALSDGQYRVFSQVLSKYKQSLDLDSLIEGLTPLFTANETHYPLMHGFSSFIRDPVDKVRFFEAYCDITGSDVPSHFTAGLNVKKEDDSRPVNDHCRVGEKRKPEENNQALANEQNRKITKVQSSSDKVFKPEYASSVSGTSSSLLDFTKHLNGGGLL